MYVCTPKVCVYLHYEGINEAPDVYPGNTVHANVQSNSKQIPTLHAA